jgi:hypothetical protein
MNVKLTLKLDQEIIEKAKDFAKNKNMSLSRLIEIQLEALLKISKKSEELYSQEVTSLIGIIEKTDHE